MLNDDSEDKTKTFVPVVNGTMVSHYRIIEKIGAGGMGEVYLAEDTELNRKVALKFLPLHLCQDADCRARFKREAQAAAKLGHSNIVAVHEVGEYHGRPFFAMELVEGRSLDKIVAEDRLGESEIVDLALGICNGLRKAHESGVIHRDIKPSNIIVDRDNVPRVLDFGLAAVRDSDRLTQTGSTLGTIGYMSPEQVAGRGADARSDLFSLGVVLYEMITGINPFRRDNQAATLKAISEDIPKPLESHRSGISGELQRIVSKLLEKRPELRYQTAADLASDLRRLSGTAPAMSRRSRKRWFVSAGIAVVLIGAIVVGYVLTRNETRESTRKMLAVLPFKNMSPDPDQEYFSDGLTEELTANLSKVHELCVISRSSAMTFKGSQETIPEIARALGVRYVVEGSVRKAGKELRVTAQLIDASDDAHLWANTYTGTLENVFDMQDSVTCAIVEGISIQLTPDDKRRLRRRPIDNPLAYEYYLRGRDEIRKGTKDDIKHGMAFLSQGLDIVGENPLIYSCMSWGHWNMVNSGFEQDDGVAKAEQFAQKALSLDPGLPDAHAMLGWLNNAFLGNQRKAVEHFKRVLLVDSTNESALRGLMVTYSIYVGRQTDAMRTVEKYRRFYPLDSVALAGQPAMVYYYSGDFKRALESYRVVRRTGYRYPWDELTAYALLLVNCDSMQAALSVIDSCIVANPSGAIVSLSRATRLALMRDGAGAVRQLTADAQKTCSRDGGWSYYLGSLLAMAGAKAEAYDWLENAVDKGSINYPFMQKDSFLDSLRGEERFKKLMERVKYEWEHFEV